ncbi:MAG: hypothetical protein V3W31_04785 [Thermodesulfobacteriota bacterium]
MRGREGGSFFAPFSPNVLVFFVIIRRKPVFYLPMLSSKNINIEECFDMFVKEIGGKLIKELLPKSPKTKNADYLFPESEIIVAELKCLEKDYFRDKDYKRKLNDLYSMWQSKGLVPPIYGRKTINTKDLPLECQTDVLRIVQDSIQRVIKKANKQIRETKEHLGLPHAKGLLLLANDGNYSLESDAAMYVLGEILKGRHYSSISSIVYFTVNMRTTIPGDSREALLWVDAYREKSRGVSEEFLSSLSERWGAFLEGKVGGEMCKKTIDNQEFLKRIKFIR